jgi:hypothetical protein
MRCKPHLPFAVSMLVLAALCAVCSGTQPDHLPIAPIIVGAVDLSTGAPEPRLTTSPEADWTVQRTDSNYANIYSGKLQLHTLGTTPQLDSAYAQFNVQLPIGGSYKLAVWQPKVVAKKIVSNVVFEIVTGDGAKEITVQTKKLTAGWNYLGTFYFPEISGLASAKVTIRAKATSTEVGSALPVDSVCLTKVYPSMVIPSPIANNLPYYSWNTPIPDWSKLKGYHAYSDGYFKWRKKGITALSNSPLTLTAKLAIPGDYHVYLWFPIIEDKNHYIPIANLKKQKFSINGLGKSSGTLSLSNQSDPDCINIQAGQWNFVGTYRFPDAQATATVTFSDDDNAAVGDVVLAGAVRFDKDVGSEVVVDNPDPGASSDVFSTDADPTSTTLGTDAPTQEFGGSWLSIAAPAVKPRPVATFMPTPASSGRNSVFLWWNDKAVSGEATVSCPR